MIFLNPGFLYALIVLAIPIIIHLFNFRRTRKIYFSNTRFLRKV
ncbi:MAG: BatA domain-containing protein, partial [Bacteroidota bacterium]